MWVFISNILSCCMFPLVFGFGWGWLVACFVPYSIVFFFTSFPYVFFYTLLGKIVVIKRKKCVSKIRRWIAALPLKIHLKTIPLHFEYKVISSTYGYLKMANNVNTIAYLGGALICMCTYSRRPWSNVAKDIRVYII